jgi:dihydrofolate reductase
MDQRIAAGMTMSLDGYISGPDDHPGQGLRQGGERLHYWVFGGPWTYDGPRGTPAPADQEYLGRAFGSAGAMLAGREMYEVAGGWGDEPGFGVPVFVVTHPRFRASRERQHKLRLRDQWTRSGTEARTRCRW